MARSRASWAAGARALDPGGEVGFEPFYLVLGFVATSYGLASMGRASQQRVVNVAQQGGMVVITVGHPPGRMIE